MATSPLDHISDEVLKRPFDDIELVVISKHIVNWQQKARKLGLSESEIENIREDQRHSNELQKENMMMKWKAKNAYKANLQQLMKVEDNDFIFHVCEELNYLKKDGKHST